MCAIEEKYYKFNRICLITLGLWPYQQSCLVRIQKAIFAGTLLTFIIVQLLVFVTVEYDRDLVFKIFSHFFPTIFVTIKYGFFIIRIESMKQLLDQMRDDWSLLRNKLEITIMEKYVHKTKLIAVFAMISVYFSVSLCTMLQLMPPILDIISPRNESRSRQLLTITEYFLNQDKYFYALLLHEMLTICVGCSALFFILATILMYTQHICALFKVASYRMENAIEQSAFTRSDPRQVCHLHYEIISAIIIHQRAIEFLLFTRSHLIVLFNLLIVIGVISTSFNIFHFIRTVTLATDVNEILISSILVIVHLYYMYITNNGGQELIDHGIQLFRTTYTGLWYVAPLRVQKLLLFVMLRGTTDVVLAFGGNVFVTSLEGFATLLSTAVSYFTVMYSML